MTEDLDMLSPEQQLALLNASGHLPKPWEPVTPDQHTYVGIYLIIVGEYLTVVLTKEVVVVSNSLRVTGTALAL